MMRRIARRTILVGMAPIAELRRMLRHILIHAQDFELKGAEPWRRRRRQESCNEPSPNSVLPNSLMRDSLTCNYLNAGRRPASTQFGVVLAKLDLFKFEPERHKLKKIE